MFEIFENFWKFLNPVLQVIFYGRKFPGNKTENHNSQHKVPYGEKFSHGFIFASHFFNISHGFNFVDWLLVDFSLEFIFSES